MQKINDIDFDFEDTEIDVLGDAYEYLIGQFAASAGKKAGEYYTPQQVSNILAQIVTMDNKDIKNVYDQTTTNMIQRISHLFARKPLILKGI